jgi:leucyl-tRNA synthetase
MVTAPSYQEPEGRYLAPDEVETRDGVVVSKASGRPAVVRVERMGKSKKNGVNPDDVVPRYGVDALRVCELFMGPPDADKVWSDAQLEGARRFLQRAWRLLVGDDDAEAAPRTAEPATGAFRATLHRAIDAVTRDMDAISYNTAIARLMELLTEMTRVRPLPEEAASAFVRMLSPHAPHVAEELWERLGNEGFVSLAPWPETDPEALVEDSVTLPVQVNGKVRGHATVPAGASDALVLEAAKALDGVRRHVEGKAVVREIVVPGRMVSLVVR